MFSRNRIIASLKCHANSLLFLFQDTNQQRLLQHAHHRLHLHQQVDLQHLRQLQQEVQGRLQLYVQLKLLEVSLLLQGDDDISPISKVYHVYAVYVQIYES